MKDFQSKEYREKQKDFFNLLQRTYGSQFEEYVTDYLNWKKTELFKGFRNITEKTDDSEAKAIATRFGGAIDTIDDILKRM